MPRVNRDLQRRLEARRERERRRPPVERRYRFSSPDAPDPETNGASAATLDSAAPPRPAPPAAVRATKAPPTRPAPRPYSAYARDYAYVLSDLRRIGIIYGSLLLALVVLFVLTQR
jgi:hypothetical protein